MRNTCEFETFDEVVEKMPYPLASVAFPGENVMSVDIHLFQYKVLQYCTSATLVLCGNAAGTVVQRATANLSKFSMPLLNFDRPLKIEYAGIYCIQV